MSVVLCQQNRPHSFHSTDQCRLFVVSIKIEFAGMVTSFPVDLTGLYDTPPCTGSPLSPAIRSYSVFVRISSFRKSNKYRHLSGIRDALVPEFSRGVMAEYGGRLSRSQNDRKIIIQERENRNEKLENVMVFSVCICIFNLCRSSFCG